MTRVAALQEKQYDEKNNTTNNASHRPAIIITHHPASSIYHPSSIIHHHQHHQQQEEQENKENKDDNNNDNNNDHDYFNPSFVYLTSFCSATSSLRICRSSSHACQAKRSETKKPPFFQWDHRVRHQKTETAGCSQLFSKK